MNYESYHQNILIKGLIKKKAVHFKFESLRARFQRSLLPTSVIDIIIYHLAMLLSECQQRKIRLTSKISIDNIYVSADDQIDPHVFLADEDLQMTQGYQLSALSVLKKICMAIHQLGNEIGTNDYYNYDTQTIEDVITISLKKVLGIPQDMEKWGISTDILLKDIYNLILVKKAYKQNAITEVFIVKTPYFINCERDIIAVKWTNTLPHQNFYEYREIQLMEKITDCKNCAKLYAYSKFKFECIFFLRYYDITLQELTNKIGKFVTIAQFTHIFIQLAQAINDLHSKDIIHRDLKPENIMFEYVQDDTIENMRCVLIDFDRSKGTQGKPGDPSNYPGTESFRPPEGTQDIYLPSYDIWQLGYIMLCFLLRKKIDEYTKLDKPITEENLFKSILNPELEKTKQQFQVFYPLISQMIEFNPKKRPSLELVIKELLKLRSVL